MHGRLAFPIGVAKNIGAHAYFFAGVVALNLALVAIYRMALIDPKTDNSHQRIALTSMAAKLHE